MKTLMEQRLEMICEWFEVEPSDIECISFIFCGKILETDYRPDTEDYSQRRMFATISRDKVTISSDGSIQRTKDEPQ
jgi:hypothetical protein